MPEEEGSLYRDGPLTRQPRLELESRRSPAPVRAATDAPEPKLNRAPVNANRTAPSPPDETVEVFVTRVSGQSFSWQVRRFGGIVVQEGQHTYPTAQLARQAGEAALTTSQVRPLPLARLP